MHPIGYDTKDHLKYKQKFLLAPNVRLFFQPSEDRYLKKQLPLMRSSTLHGLHFNYRCIFSHFQIRKYFRKLTKLSDSLERGKTNETTTMGT